MKRQQALVYDQSFEKILLRKLKPGDVQNWFDALTQPVEGSKNKPVSKSSANRYFSTVKAALNQAYKTQLVDSKLSWDAVANHEKATGRRDYFLSTKEIQALLSESKPDLQNLIKAILLTAARPGEVALAMVADFDKRNGLLSVNGKTGARKIVLSSEARAFFAEMAKDRIGLPLIHFENEHSPKNAEGERNHAWNKDLWKTAFRKARKAAGLPAEIVLYHCRHAGISQQLKAGIDVHKVAKNAGTSIKMVEEFYGHVRTEDLRSALDRIQMY